MTEYRLATPADEDALLALWVAANPGTTREAWQREVGRIPGRWGRTQVAVARDGTVLAGALFWPRQVRDANGSPLRVGTVSHVATRPEARQQGHARRLMERTIAAMCADGCAWSYLTTSETGRALYEGLGWQPFPRRVWQGVTSGERLETSDAFAIHRYNLGDEQAPWETLAQVYAAFNAARPLTVVRNDGYWQDFFAPHLSAWHSDHAPICFVAHRDGEAEACGYSIVYYSDAAAGRAFGLDQLFTVSELGVRPGDEAAVPALLAAVTRHAAGSRWGGRVYAPRDHAIESAIRQLFGGTAHMVEETEPMARPIASNFSERDLEAIFAVPSAIFWPLDEV